MLLKMIINKAVLSVVCLIASVPRAEARETPRDPSRRVQYVMGTLCDISAYGPHADEAITAAFAEIARWDRALSLYKKESDVSALNASNGAPFQCSPELWEALTASIEYAKASGGAFDPTILPVLRNGPQALASVGYQKIELDDKKRFARFRARGMAVDFGGIGKGIALDHAVKVLRLRGINAARLNLGGQIYALGAPPEASAWPVIVEGSTETFFLRDASISTSGNSEKPGHIASPFTGQRIYEDYATIVASNSATEADAWSTAVFVLGPDKPQLYQGCWLITGRRPRQAAACAHLLPVRKEKGDRS